jgi:hypothetical protein
VLLHDAKNLLPWTDFYEKKRIFSRNSLIYARVFHFYLFSGFLKLRGIELMAYRIATGDPSRIWPWEGINTLKFKWLGKNG